MTEFTNGSASSLIAWLSVVPEACVAVFQYADVPTIVLGLLEASTVMPVDRLANRLLSSVGPAFSFTTMPVPVAAAPPTIVLFVIRPKGTAAVGTAPVFDSPLKRMPAVPLAASTLFVTTTPGTSRAEFGAAVASTAPGFGAFVAPSRAASMLIP